jgi:ubiquitin carboxyl-terminal hydrolase 4/11
LVNIYRDSCEYQILILHGTCLSITSFEFRSVSNAYLTSGFGGDFLHREKIENFVDFPLQGLNLREFCNSLGVVCENSVSTTTTGDSANSIPCGDEESESDGIFYDLFAVCNHYGRMGFGHYTAMARDWNFPEDQLSPQWFLFDDEVVQAMRERDVSSSSAYILFYRKRR